MRLSRILFALFVAGVVVGVTAFVAWKLARPHSSERADIFGSVRDAVGPIRGARVHIKGETEIVETDARGEFRLRKQPSSGARVTAWKEGYLIGGENADASPLEIMLRRLPEEDSEHYGWVGPAADAARPGNCGNCHGDIYQEWSASGHARSARGKHFRNLYDGTDWNGKAGIGWSLVAQNPDGEGVCASCHAPTADYGANMTKIEGVATHGVHCDYCHKISGVGDGAIGLTHGRFNLNVLRPAEGQLFLGSLDDVDRDEDTYSPIYKDSKYCASCHEGTVFGVHVYSTYSEWLASPARREGKQCQDCHMKPTGTMTNIAPGKGGIERNPKTLANHRFFAGSQEEMLKESVKVEIHAEQVADGTKVTVEVRAEGVGHRLPTGFIDRHLLLVVEAFDFQGHPIATTDGPKLPSVAGKPLAGQAGKLFAKLLKDEDGHSPAPFWRADPDPVDTRLMAGVADKSSYLFSTGTRRVRVRVLYRRFWREVAEVKRWPDEDVGVTEKEVDVGR